MGNYIAASNFLIVDGIKFDVRVLIGVKREIQFLDKSAERTEDGDLDRELIGVYFNYKNIKFEPQVDMNYDEYNRLIDKLSEPAEFHDITINNFSFRSYFSSISDEIYLYKNNRAYFKELTVNFTSKKPTRS